MNPSPQSPFRLSRRASLMNPSAIREILKLTERPGILSLAGGLPAPEGFPVDAVREATARVLRDTPTEALQYAASEGHGPLREWVAADLARQGLSVSADQVLITSGSQQGLDLVGKVLIDAGSRVAVESPTYLGALQAFAPCEPEFAPIDGDADGPLPGGVEAVSDARFLYLVPNFQNPGGRCLSEGRRTALADAAAAHGLPLVEDNPYGELWYDAPPPAPIAARWPQGTVYLGSFSKVLAPGLRLGYVVAPRPLMPKLLQAKQAADLHTPGFNQRIVHEVVRGGFLDRHLPALRACYRERRDAMQQALTAHLPPACRWQVPGGGMFFWVALPVGCDAAALLPRAVERGMAFVPGESFFAGEAQRHTLRLSFVTVTPAQIDRAVGILGQLVHEAIDGAGATRGGAFTTPTLQVAA